MTRTREEALDFIIQQAKEGKIGPNLAIDPATCRYTYESGNHCAVGCLLSDELLTKIQEENYNGQGVNAICRTFGRENVELATGLTQHELAYLQHEHDVAFTEGEGLPPEERLKNAIENVIEAAESLKEGYRPKV